MNNSDSWDGRTERRYNQHYLPLCVTHSEKISKIETALYGNGHPENGIVWKITENTAFINNVKRIFYRCVWMSVIGCVSALGTFIMLLIKLLIKRSIL